jgi:hypothetical protein
VAFLQQLPECNTCCQNITSLSSNTVARKTQCDPKATTLL